MDLRSHCWERSTLRSLSYVVWDVALLAGLLTATLRAEPYIAPEYIELPHSALYSLARFSLWSAYGFSSGLVATGLWVIGHECGHGAFSKNRTINHLAGWIMHSAYAYLSPESMKNSFIVVELVPEILRRVGMSMQRSFARGVPGVLPPRTVSATLTVDLEYTMTWGQDDKPDSAASAVQVNLS